MKYCCPPRLVLHRSLCQLIVLDSSRSLAPVHIKCCIFLSFFVTLLLKLEGQGWLGLWGQCCGKHVVGCCLRTPWLGFQLSLQFPISVFAVDARVHGTLVQDPKWPLVSQIPVPVVAARGGSMKSGARNSVENESFSLNVFIIPYILSPHSAYGSCLPFRNVMHKLLTINKKWAH